MSQYVKDLLERVISTFLMAFLTVALVSAPDGGVSVEFSEQALIAGIAAVLSLVKGLVAARLAKHGTASLAPGV